MKIGILTFTNTLNYGALLQAYALEHLLEGEENRVDIINYVNRPIAEKEHTRKAKFSFNPIKLYKRIVMGRALSQKKIRFAEFEEMHISKSSREYTENSFCNINGYDVIVVGSDQVWNLKITHNDLNYFLPLKNEQINKISYAASFGNDAFPSDFKDKVSTLLDSFNAISVRELSGAEKIKAISGRDAEVVLDPTLLLKSNQWFALSDFRPKVSHYILVYFPHNKKKVFEFVKRLEAHTNLPVVYLSISPKIQFGVKTIYDASPEEFLGWFRFADYIVTGSFHGTAFSINMEKQFFFEGSDDNSRIGNLVKQCGLSDRSIERANLDDKIDYGKVDVKLDRLRKNSIEWLFNNLKEMETKK